MRLRCVVGGLLCGVVLRVGQMVGAAHPAEAVPKVTRGTETKYRLLTRQVPSSVYQLRPILADFICITCKMKQHETCRRRRGLTSNYPYGKQDPVLRLSTALTA